MTSYQKLKKRNEELEELLKQSFYEINELIMNPDSEEADTIRLSHKIIKQINEHIDKMLW